jgi:hypothetical protein
MIFTDLAAGDAVFVDANTLTYHFQPHLVWGPSCSALLIPWPSQKRSSSH